jgi:predicted chitinase
MANVTNILQSSIDLEHIKKCFPDESQHQTIKLIIDECLAAGINLQNQIAYVLATAKGESSFKPVEESFAYSKEALEDV